MTRTMTKHDIEVWKAIRSQIEQNFFKPNAPIGMPTELLFNLTWMMSVLDKLSLDEIEKPIMLDHVGSEC